MSQLDYIDQQIISALRADARKAYSKIAEDLNIQIDQVNVKATTTEKLGFAGRKEGIESHAVVLLVNG